MVLVSVPDTHLDPAKRPTQPASVHEEEPYEDDDRGRDDQADEDLQHSYQGDGAFLNVCYFVSLAFLLIALLLRL